MALKLKVRCTGCKKTRTMKGEEASYGPDEYPLCKDCGMPLVIIGASVKRESGK